MNKKLLCSALVAGLALGNVALAQDVLDDRWYFGVSVGSIKFDNDRDLKRSNQLGLNFGKFTSQRWSFDIDLGYTNPTFNNNQLRWSQYGLGATGRYHFRDAGATWWPYVGFGAGVWRHEREFPNPLGGQPGQQRGNNLEAHLGLGLMADLGRTTWRTEIGTRYDFDDQSVAGQSNFRDLMFSVGMNVKLGPEPQAPVQAPAPTPPPPPPVSCEDLDDDGDGVNNCIDKCPDSLPGQVVGPDGCPVPVTIDLRGVNFDFDRDTLRPDAVSTLNEVVTILRQYSDLRVEVAGHTDLCGSEDYNQNLSERRARAVYDFLVNNGISASRLVGPVGYGESRPLVPTPQTLPGCKNETNRRTELNVQN
jgi:OmpA-OmpF porin, OOP family